MIARILKATSNFGGITYSEKKVDAGKAVLMAAENFELNLQDKQYYTDAMNALCKRNSNNKLKQFHATISCKEREFDAQKLTLIGKEWIKEMGYAEQPYLIYFHSDTENNHIHIISSRVDKNGKRISPNFEGIRAVNAINKIMKNDIQYNAKKDIEKLLEYSFSTFAQAKLILEQKGWKTSENEEKINLIKNGKVQYSIDNFFIKEKIIKFLPDEQRKKQIAALLLKYSKGMNLQETQRIIKNNFGIEIIYHTGKGQKTPYGYTLIDNKNKTIYKGGDIIPLKKIIELYNKADKIAACEIIVNLLTEKKTSFIQFKKDMKEAGYILTNDGKVRLKGEYGYLYKINSDKLRKLKYNERLLEACRFKISSEKDKFIVAKMLFVKSKDIDSELIDEKTRSKYADFLLSVRENNLDFQSACNSNKYMLINNNMNIFLIDKDKRVIFDATTYVHNRDNLMDISRFENTNIEKKIDDVTYSQSLTGENLFDSVLSFVAMFGEGSEEEHDRRKRKKREHNNN